jgi:hypothetical protein
MAGLFGLFIRHMRDRRDADAGVRRHFEAEREREEARAQRKFLMDNKEDEPYTPQQFNALLEGLRSTPTQPRR